MKEKRATRKSKTKKASVRPRKSAPSLAPLFGRACTLRRKRGDDRLVYVVDVAHEADAITAHLREQGLPAADPAGRTLFAVEIDSTDDTIVRDKGFAKLVESAGVIYEWYFRDAKDAVFTHDGDAFTSLRKSVADLAITPT